MISMNVSFLSPLPSDSAAVLYLLDLTWTPRPQVFARGPDYGGTIIDFLWWEEAGCWGMNWNAVSSSPHPPLTLYFLT